MSERDVALVTGASAGIGREFCEQLAARGLDLIVVARDATRLAQVRSDLEIRAGIAVEIFPADLTRDDDLGRVVDRIAREPRLFFLINNAGFGTLGTLAEADPARQESMLRLHTLAPMRLTMAALPGLLSRRRGAVINVSSVASFIYSAGNTNYCATKAYLTTFTEGLAAELAGTGVQAQALCPGFTRSEFHQRMGSGADRPRFMWLRAESVVRASLRSLDRAGATICIPGLGYRMLVCLIRVLPRSLLGRFTGRRAPIVRPRSGVT